MTGGGESFYPGSEATPVDISSEHLGRRGWEGCIFYRLVQGEATETPLQFLVGMLDLLQDPAIDPPCRLPHGIQRFIDLWLDT